MYVGMPVCMYTCVVLPYNWLYTEPFAYILYLSFYHYVMHHYVILRHLWVYKVFILCVALEFARSELVSVCHEL